MQEEKRRRGERHIKKGRTTEVGWLLGREG
jgi:hypothetical protein